MANFEAFYYAQVISRKNLLLLKIHRILKEDHAAIAYSILVLKGYIIFDLCDEPCWSDKLDNTTFLLEELKTIFHLLKIVKSKYY